jgi:hypothetical protein
MVFPIFLCNYGGEGVSYNDICGSASTLTRGRGGMERGGRQTVYDKEREKMKWQEEQIRYRVSYYVDDVLPSSAILQ